MIIRRFGTSKIGQLKKSIIDFIFKLSSKAKKKGFHWTRFCVIIRIVSFLMILS